MIKTLADFKRDIEVGDSVIITEIMERDFQTKEISAIEVPEKIKGMRMVTYKDTTGFYLATPSTPAGKRGSFCNYPKADNLQYDGEKFIITELDKGGQIWQTRAYKLFKLR